MSAEDNANVLKRYRSMGLWGGLFLGIMLGVVIGGPQFREWESPLGTWGILIISCAAIGAIVGFFFSALVAPGTGGGSHDGGGGPGGDYGGGDGGGNGGGGH